MNENHIINPLALVSMQVLEVGVGLWSIIYEAILSCDLNLIKMQRKKEGERVVGGIGRKSRFWNRIEQRDIGKSFKDGRKGKERTGKV